MRRLRTLFSVLRAAWGRFNTELGWARSSHVALSMTMALFPFCVFALSIAVQFSGEVEKEQLVDLVFGAWPEDVAKPIVNEILAVLDQSSARSALIGAILALFFASNGVDAVRVAITHAYLEDDTRPLWKTRLLALTFVLVGAAILCCAALLGVGVPLYFHFVSDIAPGLYTEVFSSEAVRAALTMAILIFAIYAAHAWLPGIKRSAASIMPGVALTIILWISTGAVFAAYLKSFSSYSVTYAGLAGIMAALVFMYVMSAILIFSAEVNGELMRLRGNR